ncbi:WXG100 family type VII secretion target [Nocardia colli]|uniref:ESAT-6-like protein n=1 Tax=Nocardia colli TaxID=2545717 RepID=A0A5N0EKQ0_9NOCA|nr:WXG100 family type VII secretion target [Nocardia colli]KAA8887981.1 WXG100 family type VII secretion target [Nocardia colli]
MSSEFTVDLDHLDEVVAKLSGLAGFVGEHLVEIDDRVSTLTGTGWEGIAAQAYAEAHAQWIAGAREFVEGLQDMSDAAKAAHTRYMRAIDTNYKMFNQG